MAGRRVVSGAVDRKPAAAPARSARSVRSTESSPKRSGQSDPGEFVDVRRLQGEDLVAKTLNQTRGQLGVVTRPKVVDFRARLKERRKATARVILLRAVAVTAALAAVAALVWLLFFSPVFRLETGGIQVSGGNEWVSEEQIMQIAGKQTGKSLLLVSSDDVIDQLDDIPGVTEAKVSKQFPNRLRVTVRAQRPAAMLRASDGSMTAVDSEGRVLNSVGNVSVEGIPVVDVGDVDQGLSDQAVHETLSILGRLDESMRQRISSVSAQTKDSITTVLDGGNYTIVWGDSSDLKLKKAVVDKIINDPNVIGDKHQVDVSAPLRPIIK
ncbi:cell division protein FtsQ/DivIB [uncultured Bifidobacterium sp.]|uniref:cell division protein FtsQ/DivIB n=1 Tax=uncultured Bifidobacterium sp. TaxID=165187 RepID=UPI0025955507|nr:FtsQ-type POTRA domain-containing protein [uncultured Bifidobacterium sp.]